PTPPPPPPAATRIPKCETCDPLLGHRQRHACAQRFPLARKELEILLEPVHDAIELKRSPHESHRRRNEVVPVLLRRDEERDLLRQLADVVDRLLALRGLSGGVEVR